MKKRTMRCLALLLALVMVFTVLPVTVLADETAQQTYKKVTAAPEDWSGTYLIVYEEGKKAFDGSLANLDAIPNTFDVLTDNGVITGDYESKAFTVAKSGDAYTIQGAGGKYLYKTANSNGIDSGDTAKGTNTFSLNSDGSVDVLASGGAYLRFNANANQMKFRYFKSSTYTNQQPISLYKLTETSGGGETPEPGPSPEEPTIVPISTALGNSGGGGIHR